MGRRRGPLRSNGKVRAAALSGLFSIDAPLTLMNARLKTNRSIFPLLPRIFAREKVPEGRMRAGAPSAPVLQQSRCCPTARFARGPHPALRATFSHAARGRRGKLQFAALNLAPMPLTLPL